MKHASLKKSLILFLAVTGLFAFSKQNTITAFAEDTKMPIVYVDSTNGLDTSDGAAETTAVKTVSKAYELVDEYGTIIICGKSYLNAEGQKSYTPYTAPAIPVTFESINDAELEMNADINLQAETTFQKMTLVGKDSGRYLVANGHTLRFGQDLTYEWFDGTRGNGYNIIGGGYYGSDAPEDLNILPGSNLIFESGEFVYVFAGPAGNGSITDDLLDLSSDSEDYKITVNGNASIKELYLGAQWEFPTIPTLTLGNSVLTVNSNDAVINNTYAGSYLAVPIGSNLDVKQNSSTINLISGNMDTIFCGGLVISNATSSLSHFIKNVNLNITGGTLSNVISGGLMANYHNNKMEHRTENITINTAIDLTDTQISSNGYMTDELNPVQDNQTMTTGTIQIILTENGAISPLTLLTEDSEKSGAAAEKKILTLDNGSFDILSDFDELWLTNGGSGTLSADLILNKLYSDGSDGNTLRFKQTDDLFPSLNLQTAVETSAPILLDFISATGESIAPSLGQTIITFVEDAMANADSFRLDTENSVYHPFELITDNNLLKVSAKTYSISVESDGNGTATSAPTKAVANTDVALEATPNPGFKFKEWKVLTGSITIQNNHFTMPAEDVTVKAIFESTTSIPEPLQEYPFKVNAGTGGSISGTKSGSYTSGTDIRVTAIPDNGYHFTGWTIDGIKLSKNTINPVIFDMPENSVSLTANFDRDNNNNNSNTDNNNSNKDEDKTNVKPAPNENNNTNTKEKVQTKTLAAGTNNTTPPQTGDNSNIMMYVLLLLASLGGLGIYIFLKKQQKKRG
jgi:uncharacterized repeat protein (TIGR02543 family)/LPXTG-motif cell wall-anchored protein